MADTAVTAVVVVYRFDPDTTARCIASLAHSTGVDLHPVVVHNGQPTDGPALQTLCDANGATLLRAPKNDGFAAAVNLALRSVPADHHVFLLNDDAWVEPETIAACAEALDAAGASCISVAPMVVHAGQPDRVDSMGLVWRADGMAYNAYQGRRRDQIAPEAVEVLGPCFAAGLFRAGAFTSTMVGPLSERYFLYFEDVEWNVRARHHGHHSSAVPHAIASHHHALSTREMGEPRRNGMVQRNALVMALATLSPAGATRVWLHQAVVHAKALVRDPHRAIRARALLGALRLAPWALRSRRRNRGAHPVADAELFRFSAGHQPAIDPNDYSLT